MEEGKHRGKKAGTCQSDKNTPILNTFVKKTISQQMKHFLKLHQKGNKYNNFFYFYKYNNLLVNINIIYYAW